MTAVAAVPGGAATVIRVLAVAVGLLVAAVVVVLLVRFVRHLVWRCLSAVIGVLAGAGAHASASHALSSWFQHR